MKGISYISRAGRGISTHAANTENVLERNSYMKSEIGNLILVNKIFKSLVFFHKKKTKIERKIYNWSPGEPNAQEFMSSRDSFETEHLFSLT